MSVDLEISTRHESGGDKIPNIVLRNLDEGDNVAGTVSVHTKSHSILISPALKKE
jgi:hypothetical protein